MTPPQNKQLEQSLIGCLLQDKKLIPAIQAIGGIKLFYSDKHIKIYEAILQQAESGEVDVVSVSARIGGSQSYLTECLMSAPTPLLAETYANQLKDLFIRREVLILCHNTVYKIDNPDILTELESGVRDIGKQVAKVHHSDIAALVADMWEDYVENEGTEPDYMKTGLSDLDRVIDGIEKGEHVIIAGRPGMGKTAFAADVIRSIVKQGKKAIFFTMEMTEVQLVRRLICAEASISLKRYRNRKLTDAEKKKAEVILARMSKWNLQIVEGRVTVSEIKAKALQDEPDIIVIDYLQLMPIDRRGNMSTNDLVGDNVTGLQGISKTGPAVITLSQLSRESEKENRKPRLSDLYESGKIEATGDKILMPYRADKEGLEAEILIVKQKDGRIGSVKVAFLPDSVSFRKLAREG